MHGSSVLFTCLCTELGSLNCHHIHLQIDTCMFYFQKPDGSNWFEREREAEAVGSKPLCDAGGFPVEAVPVHQPEPAELYNGGRKKGPRGPCGTEEGDRGDHSAQCK